MKEHKRFYPDYLIEILFFVFVLIEITVILALLFPPSTGREIDFLSPYQPRPEWYYLWLFGLLRYFHGDLAVIGGVVIPFLAVFILFAVPWIDRRFGRLFTSLLIGILLCFFIISVFLV
ncbi:MAG: hypothetical protein N2257_03175 [Thermodesulfovibrionales bacterium]|nr:hypothetical protein [Thermodesulfovibrionales bacterium]